MTDWTHTPYAVVDVEGNGQRPPNLVELAVGPSRHRQVLELRARPTAPADAATRISARAPFRERSWFLTPSGAR